MQPKKRKIIDILKLCVSYCRANKYILLALLLSLPDLIAFTFYHNVLCDFILVGQLMQGFARNLWNGNIPWSWFGDANGGLGAPLGLFYPPGAFIPFMFLHVLDPLDSDGMLRVLIAFIILGILRWKFALRWLLKK